MSSISPKFLIYVQILKLDKVCGQVHVAEFESDISEAILTTYKKILVVFHQKFWFLSKFTNLIKFLTKPMSLNSFLLSDLRLQVRFTNIISELWLSPSSWCKQVTGFMSSQRDKIDDAMTKLWLDASRNSLRPRRLIISPLGNACNDFISLWGLY